MNAIKLVQQPAAKAFISWSLRDEDKGFIQFAEGILNQHGIEPSGTLTNIWHLLKALQNAEEYTAC